PTSAPEPEPRQETPIKPTSKPGGGIPNVPFYSQFTDISSAKWQKVGCGITALAMIIEYYHPGTVVVNTLLQEGIDAGAYLNSAGWTYAGLVGVGTAYGLDGTWYDYGTLSEDAALKKITQSLENGPVIASVHYEFNPKSTIPHLVVVTGIDGDTLYYNDPAAKAGHGHISTDAFLAAWKQRYIVIRPA
ncbi:MAG: C39 family peptidase, partial [Minisyncoccia bacterium]